jgi:hypothetical protein
MAMHVIDARKWLSTSMILLKDFSSICEPLRHPVGLDLHSDRMVRPLGFPNGSPTLEKNPEKFHFARGHEFLWQESFPD